MPSDKSEDPEIEKIQRFLTAVGVSVFLMPVLILMMLPAMAFQAYVLMKAWNWFLPELFRFPPITWAAAMAVLLVLGASKGLKTPPKESAGYATTLFLSYFVPTMSLLFCWCLRAALNAGWLSF